ncbi:MAG TPA: DUF4998 domain-containing protein [Bacteroidales bacterium]|nr:DUF4998 domain-containing protein [Bacteroidales bacterium]
MKQRLELDHYSYRFRSSMKWFMWLVLFCCLSCSNNETEDPIVKENVVVNPVQSVQIFPGYNRAKLKLNLSNTVKGYARIFWNDRSDSLQVPVNENPGKDSIVVIIGNLNEGINIFKTYLYDSKGNKSTGISTPGTVYGYTYSQTLVARNLKSAFLTHGVVYLNWLESPIGALGTEINYRDSSGVTCSKIVLPSETITDIHRLDAGSISLVCRTLYKPVSNAIDTLHTDFTPIFPINTTPAFEPKLLWDGDASKGNSVMKLTNIDPGGAISVENDPVNGSVFKYFKGVGCHRCEHHGVNGFQAKVGDDFYIGWRFKINIDPAVVTNAIFQWKAYGDSMLQNYPIVLKTKDGLFQLEQYNPGVSGNVLTSVWSTPIVVNAWQSVVLRISVSKDVEKGFIEFWYNGVKQTLKNGTTRFYCRTFDAEYCDPKWGVYGADPFEVTLWVDALRIANVYELAAPERYN